MLLPVCHSIQILPADRTKEYVPICTHPHMPTGSYICFYLCILKNMIPYQHFQFQFSSIMLLLAVPLSLFILSSTVRNLLPVVLRSFILYICSISLNIQPISDLIGSPSALTPIKNSAPLNAPADCPKGNGRGLTTLYFLYYSLTTLPRKKIEEEQPEMPIKKCSDASNIKPNILPGLC